MFLAFLGDISSALSDTRKYLTPKGDLSYDTTKCHTPKGVSSYDTRIYRMPLEVLSYDTRRVSHEHSKLY